MKFKIGDIFIHKIEKRIEFKITNIGLNHYHCTLIKDIVNSNNRIIMKKEDIWDKSLSEFSIIEQYIKINKENKSPKWL